MNVLAGGAVLAALVVAGRRAPSRRWVPPRRRAPGTVTPLGAAALFVAAAVAVSLLHGRHGPAAPPQATGAGETAHAPAPAARAAGLPPAAAGSPWSVFTQGGGRGTAVTWAKDLLAAAGLPATPANVQMIYDWETSEGGGGRFNPLNQGPVPGHPSLTSTGQQYGGGAADYRSWQAGLAGANAYLHMGSYAGVLAALRRSDYHGAVTALWNSPWAASHYGYGSAWHSAPVP